MTKHPKELWILSLVELCERFAFWGVGNLLVLYLIEYYQFPNEKATHIYGVFAGFAAFLPLIGGWIADRWNYQSPLFLGTLANVIGCLLLATGHASLLYPALMTIAAGYGIFTPSILAVLGYTYRDKPDLREAGFSIYYASINVGVFLALASLGSIAKWINWHAAFIVAAAVQLAGLIPLITYIIKHKETHRALKSMQHLRSLEKKALSPLEKRRIWVVVLFCAVSIIFWAAYIQGFSSMSIFLHTDVNKMGIPEGVFLSSESFFLLLLAPILAGLYSFLQKIGKDPSAATKTALSFFAMAACFAVMMMASKKIPSPWIYPVFAYFLMAVGEMLLAPIGLSVVSKLAPQRFTALFVGFWYVCVGVAFYSGGLLAGLMNKMGTLSNFFALFVILTLIPGILFLLFSKKITHMSNRDIPQSFTDVER